MRILDQVNLIQDHTILIREIRTAEIKAQGGWLTDVLDMRKEMLFGCGTDCAPLGKSFIC